MKRPRQQRAEATRDRILDAAEALFNDRGYDKTSMNALAEASGVSIGGLYEWFKNKPEVLTAVADRHVNLATSQILQCLSEHPELDAREQILIVLEEALALHRSKPQLHRFLYSEAPRPPELQARLREFDQLMEQTLAQHLRQSGARKQDAELRAALVARAGQALLHEFVLDDRLPYSDEYRLKRLYETLIELL